MISFPTKVGLVGFAAVFGISTVGLILQNNSLQKEITLLESTVDEKENVARDLDEQINLCIQDRPRIVSENTVPYSFEDFGIYADSLADKEVKVTTYLYKRSTIIRKMISLDESRPEGISVQVWEFERMRPVGIGTLSPSDMDRFVIFEGFNGLTPVTVSQILTEHGEQFVSDASINFSTSYAIWPRGAIAAVSLNYFEINSPSGRPILFKVSRPVALTPTEFTTSRTSPEVIASKRILEDFVDTVSFTKPN